MVVIALLITYLMLGALQVLVNDYDVFQCLSPYMKHIKLALIILDALLIAFGL